MYDTTKDERLALRRAAEELVERSKVLPDANRLIMLMRYRDGYTFAEIATVAGVHTSTIGRRIRKLTESLI